MKRAHDGGDLFQELRLVGFASDMFRNEAAALHVNKGLSLIPLPYDESTLVDRFDVRLLVESLNCSKSNQLIDLDLRKEEDMAEAERYRALHVDELEETAYKEEAKKRHNTKYGQVPLNYDSIEQSSPAGEASAAVEQPQVECDDDLQQEDLVLSNCLVLYEGITLPNSQKQYDEIEQVALDLKDKPLQKQLLMCLIEKKNPFRQFLQPEDKHHALFQCVLEACRRPGFQRRAGAHDTSNNVQEQGLMPNNSTDSENESDCELHESLRPKPATQETTKATEFHVPNAPWLAHSSNYQLQLLEQVQQNAEWMHQPYIVPPPDVKQAIDRVATYVVRNGQAKLLAQHATNPKFRFLMPSHQYHRYFRQCVAQQSTR